MNKPDKGKKDGSCNVTACQAPLAGTMQGYMRDHMIQNGRLYYCERCCHRFNEWDDKLIRARQETTRRITWDETTGPRIAGVHEDHPVCVTPQDTTPPELKAVLGAALAKQKSASLSKLLRK